MKLYLAGAFNEYTKTLRKYVEDKKIDGVHFLGFISKSDLESYWTKASIYVNPSLFEGFGMTSVESIIYGTPTLLSELAVNREVTDGLCYFYDDITNPDKLASQIISIINDNYDADSYREKSQKLAEKYSVSNIARQYVDLFENVSGVKKDKC
jgi:glycosyltransferase involved in cell wall biosynthesis